MLEKQTGLEIQDSMLIILSSVEMQICFQSLEVQKPEYAKPFFVFFTPQAGCSSPVQKLLDPAAQVPEDPARRAAEI